MVKYVNNNRKITTIIVCGKEVWGHKAGQSLFSLYENGMNENNRIIGSNSPDPYLTVSHSQIRHKKISH